MAIKSFNTADFSDSCITHQKTDIPFVLNRILANPLHNLINLESRYMRVSHPMQLGRNGN